MNETTRQQYLKLVLRVLGVVFVFGFYVFTVVWPSGWVWHAGQSNYLQMMIAIYATLGVFVLRAAGNPDRHLSIISFTIWSSIVHAGIMAVQSIMNPDHRAHLYGDVLALFLAAAVLSWLSPRAFTLPLSRLASETQ